MIEYAPPLTNQTMGYYQAELYCQFLEYNGHQDWILPTFDNILAMRHILPVDLNITDMMFRDDNPLLIEMILKTGRTFIIVPIRYN